MALTPTSNIFATGSPVNPTAVVTSEILDNAINNMQVDFSALQQQLVNSGALNLNSTVRFVNNQFQLFNVTQNKWQSLWLEGAPGAEEIVVGVGTIT